MHNDSGFGYQPAGEFTKEFSGEEYGVALVTGGCIKR